MRDAAQAVRSKGCGRQETEGYGGSQPKKLKCLPGYFSTYLPGNSDPTRPSHAMSRRSIHRFPWTALSRGKVGPPCISVIHSLIRSVIHSLIRSFIHSFIQPRILAIYDIIEISFAFLLLLLLSYFSFFLETILTGSSSQTKSESRRRRRRKHKTVHLSLFTSFENSNLKGK